MLKESQSVNGDHAFSTAHISTFPPELLTRIFHLFHDTEPSRVDYLALICSHWRSVALKLPELWTRIDCLPHPSKDFYSGVVARAKLHTYRSGELLLDVRISAQAGIYNAECDDKPVEDLCRLVAPRMRSLDLDFESLSDAEGGDIGQVLSTLLSHCISGVLTKLVIADENNFGLITTAEAKRVNDSSLKVRLKYIELNRIFSPITVLHLIGIFPQWASHAYHGLVDLRMGTAYDNSNDGNTIPEAQLVKILQASPGLRIFHFELRVTGRSRAGAPVSRAHLRDLQVIRVETGCENNTFCQVEHLLRLIEPGQKPLHVYIVNNGYPDTQPTAPETEAFFARSKVTKLFVAGLPQLFEHLPSLPHLEILFLSGQQRHPNPPTPSDQHSAELGATYPQLDLVSLIRCRMTLDEILALTQLCHSKTLILYDNEILENRPHARAKVDTKIVKRKLSAVCSDLRITRECPDWEEHEGFFSGH